MDVIAMHQAGYDNATASLGTAFTEGQAGLIKRYTTDVYLAYDSDGAGTNAAMRAIGILRKLGLSQKVINLSPYKDPDEFIKNEGVEAFDVRVRDALNGRLFEIDFKSRNYDMNDPEEKTKFMKDAGRLLAGITDKTERDNYIESVSSKYFLNKDTLSGVVSDIGMAGLGETSISMEMQSDTIDNTDRRKRQVEKKQSSPAEDNEKYLLTMMVNEQYLFKKLKGIISAEDFTEDIISDVAKKIFDQYNETGKVVPATILNSFDDAESQEKVSEICTKEVEFDTTPSIMERILTDVIIKIKTNNIDKTLRNNSNVSYIQLAKEKAEIKKIKIRL
jgi:DNA primase